VQLFEYFIAVCPYYFMRRSRKHINEHSDISDKHHRSHTLMSVRLGCKSLGVPKTTNFYPQLQRGKKIKEHVLNAGNISSRTVSKG
jgi:hypothetical protein